MRSVIARRGVAILALLLILGITPVAFADNVNPAALDARIGPPGGFTGQEPPPESSLLDLFLRWLEARIGPPGG